ncbi:MAG: restriction endonuclease subunit S [Candidatus Gastranaerophilales bacterium]|nr:restriction endonuclease subunit S [Candidatus Gastranaerophilales bacterium]
MELNVQDWKEFEVKRLFDICAGNYYSSDDYDIGTTPYVSASATNNGVGLMINLPPDFKENKIVTGKVECKAFYQGKSFSATSDANIYSPKFDMTQNVGLFLTSIISFNENGKWSYGRQCRVGDSNQIIIRLPIKCHSDNTPFIDGNKTYSDEGYVPDWQFMEDYINSLHHKPITTKVKTGNIKDLEIDKWEEFTVSKLFNRIYKAKAHTKEEVEEVEKGIHFVSRTDINNGIDTSVDDTVRYEGLEEPNCITIGDTTATCFYQNERFIAGDHMVVLRADWLNLKRGLFFRTLFAQEGIRYCYGRAYRMDLIKNTILKLPIKRNVNNKPIIDNNHTYSDKGFVPDWQFMEDYINSLPYSDRI